MDIVATRLDAAPEVVRSAAAVLSDSERQRAGRFAFESGRRRFIIARATLRRLLASRLEVQAKEIELIYGKHGKPALSGRVAESNLHFNVSHCDDLAVYAFSRGREIGVDIEAVRWFVDADDVAARFFSRAENDTFSTLQEQDKPLGFFNCWTRKEAFVKAIGDGLQYPLDSFDVTLAPNDEAKLFRVRGWGIESFSPAPGYVAAVVTEQS